MTNPSKLRMFKMEFKANKLALKVDTCIRTNKCNLSKLQKCCKVNVFLTKFIIVANFERLQSTH